MSLKLLKSGYHSMSIEESRKILDLHYKGTTQQPKIIVGNETISETTIRNFTNDDTTTVIPEESEEMINEENSKEESFTSETISPIVEKSVIDDKENNDDKINDGKISDGKINDGEKSEAKQSDKEEAPTIFEELFIDTLTKSLDKKKEKFFNSNFGDIPVEESFETLGRLCYRFLQHYRYFCVQQPITTQNEMRCRGYQQDCSQFFRPKSPLQRITEKLQSNIRLGYYKLYDMQKTMSPFI